MLLVAFLACVRISFSADYFVRPFSQTPYGNEDGSDYDNAINSLKNIPWNEISAPSNIYVCGLHIMNMTRRNSVVSQGDITPKGGASDTSRIVLRGDCAQKRGVIWGGYYVSYEEWKHEGGNCYSIMMGGDGYGDWYFQDVTEDNPTGIVLDKVNSIAECQSTPGSHFSPTYKGSSYERIYVHLTDNGHPFNRVILNRWGYEFRMESLKYFSFYDLGLYNILAKLEWKSWDFSYLTWEKIKFAYGEHSFIRLYNGHHHIKIIDCQMGWAGNGIYTISGENDAPSDYVFKGNYIHDICVRPINLNLDCHCFGIQGGERGIIENNFCERAQSGITFYTYTDQKQRDNIVRYNIVRDLHINGGSIRSRGIETGCNHDNTALRDGNEFYGNVVYNVGVGFSLQMDDEMDVHHNLAYGCSFSSYMYQRGYLDRGPQAKMEYNIAVMEIATYPNIKHTYFGSNGILAYVKADMNLYYPDALDSFYLNVPGEQATYDFEGWKSIVDNFNKEFVFDANSRIMNDLVVKDTVNSIFRMKNGNDVHTFY